MKSLLFSASVILSIFQSVLTQQQQCGKAKRDVLEDVPDDKIRNGQDSEPGDFPWAAALYLKDKNDKWNLICGGTLISPQLVLTAAHCVVFPSGREITPQDLRVKLGQLSIDFYESEDHSVSSTVKEIVPSIRYLGEIQYYAQDLALLDLTAPVPISDYVQPACIDTSGLTHLRENITLFISGWGANEFERPPSSQQWTTQTYIEYQACLKQSIDRRFISADKFCVVNNGDSGAGKGDSGGGVTMVKDSLHYIVGVISSRLSTFTKIMASTNLADVGHRTWLVREWYRMHPPPPTTTEPITKLELPSGFTDFFSEGKNSTGDSLSSFFSSKFPTSDKDPDSFSTLLSSKFPTSDKDPDSFSTLLSSKFPTSNEDSNTKIKVTSTKTYTITKYENGKKIVTKKLKENGKDVEYNYENDVLVSKTVDGVPQLR